MKSKWAERKAVMQHTVFIVVSIVLIIIGIGIQVGLGMIYHNMIMETDNMTSTDNKLLKQCKLKFWNCYQSNGGVNNIQIFVDKFLNRIKLGKWSAITLQHLSGQLVLLSVFTSGVGIYLGITGGEGLLGLLPFYIISMLGLYLFFSVSSAVDIAGKKKILKTNIVDYLENHMLERMKYVSRKERSRDDEEMVQWAMSQSSVRAQEDIRSDVLRMPGRRETLNRTETDLPGRETLSRTKTDLPGRGMLNRMETDLPGRETLSRTKTDLPGRGMLNRTETAPSQSRHGNGLDDEFAMHRPPEAQNNQNDVASRCAQFVQDVENSYEGITAEELQALLSQFFATEE